MNQENAFIATSEEDVNTYESPQVESEMVEDNFEVEEVITKEGDQLEVEEVNPGQDFLTKMQEAELTEKEAIKIAQETEDLEQKAQILEQSAEKTKNEAENYTKASETLRAVIEGTVYKVAPETIDQASYIEGRIGAMNYAVTPDKAMEIKQKFQENEYVIVEKPDVGFLVEIPNKNGQETILFLEVEL